MTASDAPALTPTGWSILGFLSLQDRNGYEIRQAARRSVEHFWGVSDGQLYPQLGHLHGLGLIAPLRKRAQDRGAGTTWRLTPAGRKALCAWLRAPSAATRSRDENLVKLMFADELGRDGVVQLLHERRASFELMRQQLAEVEPGAHRHGRDEALGRIGPRLAHGYGRSFLDAAIAWCDGAITELTTGSGS
jgi:DNA-binding PadR family transcriptional regulator